MATLPTTRTWVADTVVTAAQMNSDVRDLGNFVLSGKPITIMYRSTSLTGIANNTWTNIPYDTEDVDRDGNHNTVTNTDRWTCVTAGYYLFTHSTIPWTSQATAVGTRACRWLVNNADTGYFNSVVATNGDAMYVTPPTFIKYCGVNDYVTMAVRHTAGAGVTLDVTSTTTVRPYMAVYWLSQ